MNQPTSAHPAADRAAPTTTAALISVGRPTFDVALGSDLAVAARAALAEHGVDVVVDGPTVTEPVDIARATASVASSTADVIVVLQATFADASAVIDIAEATETPIVVWSFPEGRTGGRLRLNSLCGANLAAYSLHRRSHRCGFVHGDPRHGETGRRAVDAIERAVTDVAADAPPASAPPMVADATAPPTDSSIHETAVRVDRRLRASRIGVIGDPPTGFEPCAGDDRELESSFGVGVLRLGLDDLFDAARAAERVDVDAALGRVSTSLRVDADLGSADLEPSARLYCSMRRLADRNDLAAIATRCWPECMVEFGGAACTPQAMLTEDRVPGVCEADVYGALTALVLQLVGDSDPFIADLVDVDDADGTSVLWHCGVASTHLADPGHLPAGTVHPNRGVPLINEFALRPGRVTVARISQCGRRPHLVLGGGTMLDRTRPFDGTCGTIRWDLPVRDVAASIFGLGIEHHLGVIYGEHRGVLAELAQRWGIPVLHLGLDGLGNGPLEPVSR